MPKLCPARFFDVKEQCFITHRPDKYAILSHRWDKDEWNYELLQQYCLPPDRLKPFPNRWATPELGGLNKKLKHFGDLAFTRYGCQYVWMDSVCINRENSQELQDAIQSMYWYYRHAEVCIVYLGDACDRKSFASSSWFTRGWTLQELLAPSQLAFYYKNWKRARVSKFDIERGRRWTWGGWVKKSVIKVTGIDEELFRRHYLPSPDQHDIVLKWSQSRTTSRDEDAAYSLVSLLDVCLPPDYSEGRDSALRRLGDACKERAQSVADEMRFLNTGSPSIEHCSDGSLVFAKSALCKAHQERAGNPTLLYFYRHYDRIELSVRVLFTSIPILDLPRGITVEITNGVNPTVRLHHELGVSSKELIPSVTEKCAGCEAKAIYPTPASPSDSYRTVTVVCSSERHNVLDARLLVSVLRLQALVRAAI